MIINGKKYKFESIEVQLGSVPYIPHITPAENNSMEFYYRRGNTFYFRNRYTNLRFELPINAKNYFKKGCKYTLDIKSEFKKELETSDLVTIPLNIPKL